MSILPPSSLFWLVMPNSIVAGYQRFRGPWCPHGRLKQRGPLKRWYPS